MTAVEDPPVARRIPALRDEWEYDPPHLACQNWISAWRQDHPDGETPPLRFAGHVGRCAMRLHAEGLPKVELARLFSAAGYDGTCACGLAPEQSPPTPPTTKEPTP